MNVTRKARPFDKDDFPAGNEACCLAFFGAGAATILGFLGLAVVAVVGAVSFKEAGGGFFSVMEVGGGSFSVMEAGGGGGLLAKSKIVEIFSFGGAFSAAWGVGLVVTGDGSEAAMAGLGGIFLGGGAALGLFGAETKPELGLLSFILPPAPGT